MENPAILIVDDDPVIRMVTTELTSELGFRPLAASSADEALAILRNRADIDLVITDLVMPGTLDGLALSAEIRRLHKALPIVIVSGRMPAEVIANDPGLTFLPKPFTEAQLIAALDAARQSSIACEKDSRRSATS